MVSYDAPVDMRKYVHRVGRTARAGREGDAWTLVEEQEVCVYVSFVHSLIFAPYYLGSTFQNHDERRQTSFGCEEIEDWGAGVCAVSSTL